MSSTCRAIFGVPPSATSGFFWASICSHVFGQVSLDPKDYASPELFDAHVMALYGVTVDRTIEPHLTIVKVREDIAAISKTQRRKKRREFLVRRVRALGGVHVVGIEPPEQKRERPKSTKAVKKEARRQKLEARAKKRTKRRSVNDVARSKPVRVLAGPSTYSREAAEAFYKSWEWRTLRMEVLKQFGRTCQCCGAKPGDSTTGGAEVRIVVDHIKSLSKHWQMRLTRSNLQVLCDECNMGKGNWDESDYRFERVEWSEDDPLTLRYRQIMGGLMAEDDGPSNVTHLRPRASA